ncbi:hypothetical protein [Spirosoma sp. 48-14]|uniref:hypothetical protein n=1 Tax=Spirosoma sp. 48-14 TaxID=1895854 RepID=UPI00095F55EF|nr:hypothetical protein [Spirosoma sp. 48-14]OJW76311.1 MAG: hypothetical protein BGO59_22595 [Spirosoma sp. 48-14]
MGVIITKAAEGLKIDMGDGNPQYLSQPTVQPRDGAIPTIIFTSSSGVVNVAIPISNLETIGGNLAAEQVTDLVDQITALLNSPISSLTAATAARQDTGNNSLAAINTVIGAKGDAAATTDTGSFSVIAFIKRILGNWTTLLAGIITISNGQTTGNSNLADLNTVVGAKADAPASSDSGSFSVIAFIKRTLANWTTLLTGITTISTGQTTGNASLADLNTAIGVKADAAATTDTGSFSILAFIKRSLANWTTLQAKLPSALISDRLPVDLPPMQSSITHTAGTITAGGTAQQAVAAQAGRKYLFIQNVSDTPMSIRFDGTDATASTGILLAAGGGSYQSTSTYCPTSAVSIIGATTGKAYVVVTN